MDTDRNAILALIDDSLRFDYQSGSVNPVDDPFTTGWRTMDAATNAQITGGRFQIEIEGAEPLVTEDGCGNCIAAGVRHRITLLPGGTVVSRWSHVTFTVLAGFDLLQLFDVPIMLSPAVAERVGAINTELWELHRHPIADVAAVIRRKTLGLRLLDALIRDRPFRPAALERLRAIERVNEVLALIHDGLDRPLAVAELAASMGLSAARFHAVFKSALGVAPRDYVRTARMQRARQLLLHAGLSVAEVAARVGFEDQFHFSRAFKQVTGMSPMRYREIAAGGVI